ncbi:MAG TPA: thioredoxin domain-containing protein [Aigarchaeota archaeon]|nr:thioredoxin domain-containing protein [Aigarchaeota archaeon]
MGRRSYLEAAEQAAGFILRNLTGGSGLLRRYREGEAAIPANLEDYAFLIEGLINLYEACYDVKWLEKAVELAEEMIKRLWDPSGGGFFFKSEAEETPMVIKECRDGVTPSGNSAAVICLIKLSEYTGRVEYLEKAEETLKLFWRTISNDPAGHTYALLGLDLLLSPRREVVVVGDELDMYRKALAGRYMPDTVSMLLSDDMLGDVSRIFKLAEGREVKNGKTTAYVCRNFTCKLPTNSYEEFIKQIEEA